MTKKPKVAITAAMFQSLVGIIEDFDPLSIRVMGQTNPFQSLVGIIEDFDVFKRIANGIVVGFNP